VAIVPSHSDRGLLQTVSAEARADGVREGMPVYQARRLCPSLMLIPPDPLLAARAMENLLRLAGRYSPTWEAAAPGRLYLDLTGSGRLHGSGRDVAARMEKEIGDALTLWGTVGLAGNKLVSRIASEIIKRPGVCEILRGSEKTFIGPLPVGVLPGVGSARQTILQELNLRRVEQVASPRSPTSTASSRRYQGKRYESWSNGETAPSSPSCGRGSGRPGADTPLRPW
jgi:DNA polymerase-4